MSITLLASLISIKDSKLIQLNEKQEYSLLEKQIEKFKVNQSRRFNMAEKYQKIPQK